MLTSEIKSNVPVALPVNVFFGTKASWEAHVAERVFSYGLNELLDIFKSIEALEDFHLYKGKHRKHCENPQKRFLQTEVIEDAWAVDDCCVLLLLELLLKSLLDP